MSVERTEHQFVAMGGGCRVLLDCSSRQLAIAALNSAEREVRRLDRKYSDYLEDSLLSRINRQAGSGESTPIDPETYHLLRFATTLWQQSGELFDPSCGVLRQAWRQGRDSEPASVELAQAVDRVGWRYVQLQKDRVSLSRAGMALDFGGFVKEYAVDTVARGLLSLGVESALVDLAGDMYAIGRQGDGSAWRVGIRDPARRDGAIAWIELENAGLASSGNYERYVEIRGKRYGHIYDPLSGEPVARLQAVSVAGSLCLVAGAAATIAMLLPPMDALDWLRRGGLPWLAVDAHGKLLRSGQAGQAHDQYPRAEKYFQLAG